MVTVSHPSMSALLTLTVVDLPWFEALAAAVQSTATVSVSSADMDGWLTVTISPLGL